jgi:hypothetical protein
VTWFKVDDRFHHHPKAIAAGPAAIGLWTIAGSWSVDNLTDGFIPRHVLVTLTSDPNRGRLAKRLVQVGLWEQVGEDGWQFHDWGEDGRQKTSGQIKAERKATRDRQAKWREAHRNGVTNAFVTPVVTRESHDPHLTSPLIGVDVVTDPARGRHRQPVENPYLNGQSRPGDGAAARHPSVRPLRQALADAGINGTQPADDDTIQRLTAEVRHAITQETP